MDEDEAALLAELRAISNKSATSRFADDENEHGTMDENGVTAEQFMVLQKSADNSVIAKAVDMNLDEKVTVSGNAKHEKIDNVIADTGGPTQRSDLQTIGESILSRDSFQEQEKESTLSAANLASRSPYKRGGLPPWKRRQFFPEVSTTVSDSAEPSETTISIVTADPTAFTVQNGTFNVSRSSVDEELHSKTVKGDILQPKILKTNNQSELSDAAQDAELLALLRGVSAKSASASRFDDDEDSSNEIDINVIQKKDNSKLVLTDQDIEEDLHDSLNASNSMSTPHLPPWKRRHTKPKRSDLQLTFSNSNDTAVDQNEGLEPYSSEVLISGDVRGKENFTLQSASAVHISPRFRSLRRREFTTPKAKKNGTSSGKSSPSLTSPLQPTDIDSSASHTKIAVAESTDHFGFKSQSASTFRGDRGGPAEDAELLALLRGVSAKSAGASRFADNDDGIIEHIVDESSEQNGQQTGPRPLTSDVFVKNQQMPPWKRKGSASVVQTCQEADIINDTVSSETFTTTDGEDINKADTSSCCDKKRDCSEPIEDAVMLPLMQGVTANSVNATCIRENSVKTCRMASNETTETPINIDKISTYQQESDKFDNQEYEQAIISPQNNKLLVNDSQLSWKQPKYNTDSQHRQNADVVAVLPASQPFANAETDQNAARTSHVASAGMKSELPTTFKGDRGGPAEDAELLALLRGVSAKSASASRFRDDDDVGAEEAAPSGIGEIVLAADKQSAMTSAAADNVSLSQSRGNTANQQNKEVKTKIASDFEPSGVANQQVPPWKRRGNTSAMQQRQNADVAAVLPASQPFANAETDQNAARTSHVASAGMKSELPTTFKGDRGGPAEDAELLALLRGVSAKSASASRFRDDDDVGAEEAAPSGIDHTLSIEGFLQKPEHNTKDDFIAVLEDKNSDVSQKLIDDRRVFAGEAISCFHSDVSIGKSFLPQNGNDILAYDVSADVSPRAVSSELDLPHSLHKFRIEPPSVTPAANVDVNDDDLMISRDNIASSLNDKNWKVRSQAFEFLCSLLKQKVSEASMKYDIDANILLDNLDALVPSFLSEANVGALDKALSFVYMYAEYCLGATLADQASKITSVLIQKNGLSARPSTVKLAVDVILKLMEVGANGASSLHSCVNIILEEGINSKKPKVVMASSSLIVDTALEFGAAMLPFASVASALPKLLSHSSAKVRDSGIWITAEIVRATGSKAHLQAVFDNMKTSQTSQVDALLEAQPAPSRARRKLRYNATCVDATNATKSLDSQVKELEAERFAMRSAVDLMAKLHKTDFSSRIGATKWSEKVAALELVIECAGDKPYKLCQPSVSVNYGPLISELKKQLSHTHFAVNSKAMEVLSVLAMGVGEKLFSSLRPLLPVLLQLAKDKKLTNATGSCLDAFFGNVLSFDHLLEEDEAVPDAVNDRKEKNALARSSALEFLARCVQRNKSAGPRGMMVTKHSKKVALLCVSKLEDSNAAVRKASHEVLMILRGNSDPSVAQASIDATKLLQQKNPRAFKALNEMSCTDEPEKRSVKTSSLSPSGSKAVSLSTSSPVLKQEAVQSSRSIKKTDNAVNRPGEIQREATTNLIPSPVGNSVEEATEFLSQLRIPCWDVAEDDGGILSGLKSSKWMLRQNSILSLVSFFENGSVTAKQFAKTSTFVVVLIKAYTKSFKETNVNVIKAVIQLFATLCNTAHSLEIPLNDDIAKDAVSLSLQKISDRKLSALSKSLLTNCCIVAPPSANISNACGILKTVKSPVIHEEFLSWLQTFFVEFGAFSLESKLSDVALYLVENTCSTNVKVKRGAFATIGLLHEQVGPSLRVLCVTQAKGSTKEEISSCCDGFPYDSSLKSAKWPQKYLFGASTTDAPGVGFVIALPRSDLAAVLSEDCISRLGSTSGKTAWKVRKEALDEIEAILKNLTGLLEVSGSKAKLLLDLCRALRGRLSDTQINLRPLCARCIELLFTSVDKETQSKIGKLVYPSLINIAINDIKKPMRDAALSALRAGITASPLENGGLNDTAVETFVSALVDEVNDTSLRATGLPDVLSFVTSIADHLPNLESSSTKGQFLAEKYATFIVECLTSSKSDARSAATSLLTLSIERNVIEIETTRRSIAKMKPAKQRAVCPLLDKLLDAKRDQVQSRNEKLESVARAHPKTSLKTSPSSRQQFHDKQSFDRATLAVITKGVESEVCATVESTIESPMSAISDPVAPTHPLFTRRQTGSIAFSTSVWPEYPEEPQGLVLFESLKKTWSVALPSLSVTCLFPAEGIKKQDDAQEGCALLLNAISLDVTLNEMHVLRQLELILKWIAYVLCCKEATVGLQALLALITSVFSYLVERKHELSDVETLLLIPFLIEKASTAKGRFRDLYVDVVSKVQDEVLLPAKRLGLLVCVNVLECSSQAKARSFACRLCISCVEKEGLTAIGKRGVMVGAKALSDETIPDNRSAALILMSLVLAKMNGDVMKLARICGPNLSDKARQLLKERSLKNSKADPCKVETSQLQTSVNFREEDKLVSLELQDQLPALSLRGAFNLPSCVTTSPTNVVQSTNTSTPLQVIQLHDTETSIPADAASLRERLLRIRKKSAHSNAEVTNMTVATQPAIVSTAAVVCLNTLKNLLLSKLPLSDEDKSILESVDALKKFHAALTKQQHVSTTVSGASYAELRLLITKNMKDTLETFTSILSFAFSCGDSSVNAGMSIPLLSVCLATLMALFRDVELAALVSKDDLIVLIRRAGTALLDPRLASSSMLDEGTASQMVRAINKLAVQAATGSRRLPSFLALISLQLQLLTEITNSADEYQFSNSRLSRVVSKLFARVIKAEEAAAEPFASSSIDMEVLVKTLEDFLSACSRAQSTSLHSLLQDSVENCRKMVRSLVLAIIQERGSAPIMTILNKLEMNTSFSCLAAIVSSIEALHSSTNNCFPVEQNTFSIPTTLVTSTTSSLPVSPVTPSRGTSRDIAALLSALANAQKGSEREHSLAALRQFMAINGDEELLVHLKQVSSPFQAFIENELYSNSATNSHDSLGQVDGSMFMRLKNLRSRLEASEGVACDDAGAIIVQNPIEESPAALTSNEHHETPFQNIVEASRAANAISHSSIDYSKLQNDLPLKPSVVPLDQNALLHHYNISESTGNVTAEKSHIDRCSSIAFEFAPVPDNELRLDISNGRKLPDGRKRDIPPFSEEPIDSLNAEEQAQFASERFVTVMSQAQLQSRVAELSSEPDYKVQTTMHTAALASGLPSVSAPKLTLPSKLSVNAKKRASRLSHPSPSKLPQPSTSKIPTSPCTAATTSLRERLVASQESRSTNTHGGAHTQTMSSMGRAAALRARLEAVKRKGKSSFNDS